jgi:hypothetical protein
MSKRYGVRLINTYDNESELILNSDNYSFIQGLKLIVKAEREDDGKYGARYFSLTDNEPENDEIEDVKYGAIPVYYPYYGEDRDKEIMEEIIQKYDLNINENPFIYRYVASNDGIVAFFFTQYGGIETGLQIGAAFFGGSLKEYKLSKLYR